VQPGLRSRPLGPGRGRPGPPSPRRGGDLLSDFRQFGADLGLEPDGLEAKAALVAGLVRDLERQEAL